jgi:hypothetical protein
MGFHFRPFVMVVSVALGLAGCVDKVPDPGGTQPVKLSARNVLIVNNAGQAVWGFYGSPVTTNIWEEDILGANILPAGQSVNIDFADGRTTCDYDMKAEFQDGTSIVKTNIDVCTVSSVSFP